MLCLSACAPTVVTKYNGSSIRIQSMQKAVTYAVLDEARRICGTQGLLPEYASTAWNQQTLVSNHLFLCLTRTKPNAGLPSSSHREVSYLEKTSTL